MTRSEKMMVRNPGGGLVPAGELRKVPSVEISDSGVSIGFECLDREMFDPEKCYEKLGKCGVKYARCQTGWNRCEIEKGIYNFAWLDRIVDSLLANGVRPWFNVGYGNALYMPDVPDNETRVGCVPLFFGKECLAAWKNFVSALCVHFGARVSRWEIWNEPEGESFWYPHKPDPLEYASLIRVTASVIREHLPDAMIGSCSNSMFNALYHPVLIRSGIASVIDFHSFHCYRIQPENEYTESLGILRRLFDENGGKHVKIAQGESGYASWFPMKHWLGTYIMNSEDNQAKWLLRRYATDFSAGVFMSSFFQMADMMGKLYKMSGVVRKNPARHGLLNGDDYTEKRSYEAMSHVCALFDSETVPASLFFSVWMGENRPATAPVSRLPEIALRKYSFLRRGYPLYLYYLPEDVQMDYPGDTGLCLLNCPGETPKKLNNPVLIDMLTGNLYDISDFDSLDGEVHCMRNLPLTDYPLVITDKEALSGRILSRV